MKPDGSAARELTGDIEGGDFRAPGWSPDGSKIVCTSERDIFVVNVDGSGAVNLTNDPLSFDSDPAWSPVP